MPGYDHQPGTGPQRGERRRQHDQDTIASQIPPRRGRGGRGGPPEGPPPGERERGRGRGDGEGRGWRRFIPSWKIVVAGCVVVAAGIFGMIMVGYSLTPVPTSAQAKDAVDDMGSTLYYENGKEVLAKLGVKRIPVQTIGEIPAHVQDAVIAAENSSFRDDSGISFSGMVRSLWFTATGQQIQGASTITQQMARNYYDGLSQERSLQRKVKEIFVAVKLNQSLTKDQILLQYLNTIYFGRGANGIGAAAQYFFDKKVSKLTPEEGAYLAGRIQNPSSFDTSEKSGDNGPTEYRYKYVLEQMGKLDPAKYSGLLAKSPTSPKRKADKQKDYYKGVQGYMIRTVIDELRPLGIDEDDLKTGGYKIRTTFDKKLMEAAKRAVNQHTRNAPKEVMATLAAVDPRTGRIRAFYGGDDYATDAWNDAFMSVKQAASAFKPYVLAAWLEQGYSLRSYLPAKGPIELPGTSPINNDHPSGATSVDVVKATASSVNTAFAKMGEKVGLQSVVEIASRAGIDKERLEETKDRQSYLLTIGSSGVTAVEQAGGYSIFANQGKHIKNHVIIKATDRNGQVVVDDKNYAAVTVISPEAAADATVALQAVVKSGTGRNAALYDRPVAGKTGTNNDNKDVWFVGFTPQISTAVGMYKQECRTAKGKLVAPVNDNCPWYRGKDPAKEKKYTPQKAYSSAFEVPLPSGYQGATYPAAIWKTFMTEATKGDEVMQFPPRADGGVPENLAPKPTPTPTPTPTADPENPFEEEDPNVGCPLLDPACQDDGDVSVDEETGDGSGIPEGDGDSMMGRGAAVPNPMPSRRED
ncbi:transglycosylase domain-containing protein [Nonomuraea typhae]|uniref:transglycosylase domain-containing protein n=1 Tax=Nonomuraea typhae TaxID=2603600 RepID=UPI0012F8ED5F|nr:transglycosylase domain-containing protein [Nonomuraea typhae]